MVEGSGLLSRPPSDGSIGSNPILSAKIMKILVLGDCQSNGNNCLADQVLEENSPRTWSLRFHKNFPQALKWYLKHSIKNKVTDPITTKNIESAVWTYLRQQELNCSWPNLLNGRVVNRSLNGAHFVGYHKRLLQYLDKHGRPDRVLVTDFTFPHIASSFKYQGKRYVFEKSPNYGDVEYNPDEYPIEVHRELVKRMTFQLKQTRDWYIRKHHWGYWQLTKVLNYHKLQWSVVRFGDDEQENIDVFDKIMGRGIDCIDLLKQYHINGAEDGTKKLKIQSKIAERVQQHL